MKYLKILFAILSLVGIAFGFYLDNQGTAAEKWHAEGELDPKADFEIESDSRLPSTRYIADTAHSSILFRASHWEIVDIIGWFADYEIVMYSDEPDFLDAVIEAKVKVNSVCMPNKRMQGHIQQEEYFHTEKYPEVGFKSSGIRRVSGDNYIVLGEFTLLDKTVSRYLMAEYRGHAYPNEKPEHGWKVTTYLTHDDFGWDNSGKLHSGRLLLEDTIWVECNLRME